MQQSLIRTYKGRQKKATEAFQADATKLAMQGYVPASQSWAPGAYGCGSFVVAILLCFIVIGIVVFIYMLIVKPEGTLTVTYTLQASSPDTALEKTCPKCAEQVKAAAQVCRYCGHSFT